MQALPQELIRVVAKFLSPEDIPNLHCTSKELRDSTSGVVSRREYHSHMRSRATREAYHDYMGRRLWRLRIESNGLRAAHRELKKGTGSKEVFRKAISLPQDWWGNRIFTTLCGVMDSLADTDRIPIPAKGHPGTDCYYGRHGIDPENPLPISTGPEYTAEDLALILAWLRRLHEACLDVLVEARKIAPRHEIYGTYPRRVKAAAAMVERRVKWLQGR